MNSEQNRLETFNDWPSDAPVSPQRIARAGFFYIKRAHQVECFSCAATISEWSYGDQVMARHRALSPQCAFVLNPATSGNIPAVVTPPVTPSSSFLDYKNEDVRLSTFVNWPKSDIVTPEDLARAGFYSLRTRDNTKCAFCEGVVRAWEPNDIPDIEHKRHFPLCAFVISTINPRLENSQHPGHTATSQESTFKNVNIIGTSVSGNLNELGVQKHNGPKRADFGTIESRLRSFATWSPHLIQTPDMLAQAGFYYEGMGDQVRCFHCDGGLRNWDPDDDPWTEHARWFPRCSFVNLVKGQEFVTACSLDINTSSSTQSEKVRPVKKKRQVTEEELQMHLSGEVAFAALGIGIDMQRVKRALKQKIELTGRGYSQPDALVEAALNMQLEEEDGFESGSPSNNQVSMSIATVLSDITKATDASGQYIDPASQPRIPQQSATNGEWSPRQLDLLPGGKLEKSISLEEENRLLKEARQCKICMDAEVGIVFLPCGHLTTCVNCAPNLEDCPVCRSAIKATVRTFLS